MKARERGRICHHIFSPSQGKEHSNQLAGVSFHLTDAGLVVEMGAALYAKQ
jgi:rubredoxin